MAASNAVIGYGADLLKGDGGSPTETFTTTGAEIVSITPPGYTRDAIDVSHMKTDDQFREYIAGMMDAGEVSIEVNFIPAASDTFETALRAGKQNWRILFNNDIAWTFGAILTSYAPNAPLDDKQSATVTFKVSGKPTLSDES